jgi:hypothetical protein
LTVFIATGALEIRTAFTKACRHAKEDVDDLRPTMADFGAETSFAPLGQGAPSQLAFVCADRLNRRQWHGRLFYRNKALLNNWSTAALNWRAPHKQGLGRQHTPTLWPQASP